MPGACERLGESRASMAPKAAAAPPPQQEQQGWQPWNIFQPLGQALESGFEQGLDACVPARALLCAQCARCCCCSLCARCAALPRRLTRACRLRSVVGPATGDEYLPGKRKEKERRRKSKRKEEKIPPARARGACIVHIRARWHSAPRTRLLTCTLQLRRAREGCGYLLALALRALARARPRAAPVSDARERAAADQL